MGEDHTQRETKNQDKAADLEAEEEARLMHGPPLEESDADDELEDARDDVPVAMIHGPPDDSSFDDFEDFPEPVIDMPDFSDAPDLVEDDGDDEGPSDPGASARSIVDMECPSCGEPGSHVAWWTIDAANDRAARTMLFSGRLNFFRCTACEHSWLYTTDVLYYDEVREFAAQFLPYPRLADPDVRMRFTPSGKLYLLADELFDGEVPEYAQTPHVVFSMNELVRYVRFREELADEQAESTSGGILCFSCGGDIQDGEDAYIVSRLAKQRGLDGTASDELLDSTASIQVCARCAAKAGEEKVELEEAPVQAIELEVEGLNRYAKKIAPLLETMDEEDFGDDDDVTCSLCGVTIELGDPYTQVDVERQRFDGLFGDSQGGEKLGVICKKCTREHNLWDDTEDDDFDNEDVPF